MAVVAVTDVTVKRNPSPITDSFELEVVFDCCETLPDDLAWRLVYVGDANDKSRDQELDCIALGPVQKGRLRFTFFSNAPDFSLIDKEDIPGITIILLTGSYRNQEFVRIGWYVHNMITDPILADQSDLDVTNIPLEELLPKIQRVVLAEAPRVTRFNIDWGVVNKNNNEGKLLLQNNACREETLRTELLFGEIENESNQISLCRDVDMV